MFRASSARPNRSVLLLLLAAAALTTACVDDDTIDIGATADVTVMTRNLYLGGDVFQLVTSQDPLPVTVARLYGTAAANNFAARAGALAAEIEANAPHLVGLQEVSLYRIQDPSDFNFQTGQNGSLAETVVPGWGDYLAVLMDSLEARGLEYEVVAQVQNADVELPAAKSQTEFFDVRLTDRDVILARSDVQTAGGAGTNFQTNAAFPVAGQTVPFPRGYTWVNATVEGASFMFVNAHLEVDSELDPRLRTVQTAQAYELTSVFGTLSPLVMVGDFNSEPGLPPYNALTAAFPDAWSALGTGDGLTCCRGEILLGPSDPLYSRIDLILFRGAIDVLSIDVVGEEETDRTSTGHWPSDHAGVVATLRISE